jgi:hypothetical protein
MALRRMSDKFTRPKNKGAEADSSAADFPNAIAKEEPKSDSKKDLAAEKGGTPIHAHDCSPTVVQPHTRHSRSLIH